MKKFSLILIASVISLFWTGCKDRGRPFPRKTSSTFNKNVISADSNGIYTIKNGEISLWPDNLSSQTLFFYNGNISDATFIVQEGLLHMRSSRVGESFTISKIGQKFNIQKLNLSFNRAHFFDTLMCFLQPSNFIDNNDFQSLMFSPKNLNVRQYERIQSFDAKDFARTSDSSLFLIKTNAECITVLPNRSNLTRINHENIENLIKPIADNIKVSFNENYLFIMKENMVFVNKVNGKVIENQSIIK